MDTRKELKEQYKKMKKPMGIFTVSVGDKTFIDSGVDVRAKWNRHKLILSMNKHENKNLQKKWDESGEKAFQFELISELKPQEDKDINYRKELNLLLEMTIEEMRDKGLNLERIS